MPDLSTISFVPPSPEDASALTRIHARAFPSYTLLDLMFGPQTEENLKGFQTLISQLIATSKTAKFVKAVDNATNEIVGWAWWIFYPDLESYIEGAKAYVKDHGSPPKTAISREAYLEYFQTVISKREKWIGARHTGFLQVLVVLPEYQGRGIGTQLVKMGLEDAKTLNLPVWLESSPEGYALYKKLGFNDLNDNVVIDLTKYGESGTAVSACMLFDNNNA
ncbi:hypothetical protein BBP40_005122 [Aspergillus hancockii]|nr:hypothetical protein BBP40_005122 [Aspergillus hancockii]